MHLRTILLIMLTFYISKVNAQQNLDFQDLAPMLQQRGLITSSCDAQNMYVSHGFAPSLSYTTEIEKYNIANNIWSLLSNSSIGKRYANSEVVSNNLYIYNGLTATGYNNKLEKVDVNTGVITFLTDNPYPVRSAGNCAYDNKIYFFGGGMTSGYSNKLYSFDINTLQWTELANMQVGRETKGEVVNGIIYAVGGYNGSASNSIDAYDIATNSWNHLLDMPMAVSAHSTAVFDNKIWIIGDYTNLTHIGYYDITTNQYVVCTNTNMIGRKHFGAEVVDGKLYIMGGNQTSSSTSSLNSLQMFDFDTLGSIDENLNLKLSVFPNPFYEVLHIQSVEGNITSVKVYDTNGRFIHETLSTQSETQIDLSHLPPAMYVLQITIDDVDYRVKVLKE